jgi:hypothetical protein
MATDSILAPSVVAFDGGGANWMTAGAGTIGDKTFRELTLPASHDSGMHVVRGVPVIVDAIGRGTRTQQLDLYQQIVVGGARVVDLRPVAYTNSPLDESVPSGYYAAHWSQLRGSLWGGLVGQSLAEMCDDLRRVLADLDRGETLVIGVSHAAALQEDGPFGDLAPNDQRAIVDLLLEACAGHLYTAQDDAEVDLFDLTPNRLAARGTGSTAFLSVQDSTFGQCGRGQSDGCFGTDAFRTHSTWAAADTNDVNTFMTGTRQALRTYGGGDGPLYLSWQLTWQPQEPWQSLEHFASVLNPQLPGTIATWLAQGDITAASRPVSIGGNFLTAAVRPDGSRDPFFETCLTMNGLL